jgi:2-dehydro-3-deoxyphosphogluconate aldolase/(4S)-4-hydroxy-2-oxoglutarate aldolase
VKLEEGKNELVAEMDRRRLVAVVRSKSAAEALATARAAAEGGVGFIEIALTVPGAFDVIQKLAQDPALYIGAGTVLSKEHAWEAIDCGARFVVSPTLELDLIPICREAGIVCATGAATPTEILSAVRSGTDMVKIFPADCLGGPKFVRQVMAALPKAATMVSGGVDLDNVKEYVDLGVTGIVLGSAMLRDLLAGAGHEGVVKEVRRFVEAVAEVQTGVKE